MKKEKNYRQEFERKFSEQNHKKQIQKILHETREELLEKVKALDQRQHEFPKDCVKCNYRGTYFVTIEPNLDEFSYKSLEEDIAEVICPKNELSSPTSDKMDSIEKNISVKVSNELFKQFITVHSVNFVLPGDYRTVSELATKYALEESFNITEQKLLRTVQRSQSEKPFQENALDASIEIKRKIKDKKGHIINRLRTPSKRKTQKRNERQKKRVASIKEQLGSYDSVVFKQKLLAASKSEQKSFTRTLRKAVLKYSEISNGTKPLIKQFQIKNKISELNKKFPLNPDKFPPPYHDLKSKYDYERKVISQYYERLINEKPESQESYHVIRELKPVKTILELYFAGSRHAISTEQQIVRNYIQDCVGYKNGDNALFLVLRYKELKKTVEKELKQFRSSNKLNGIKNPAKIRKSIVTSYTKYKVQKEQPIKKRKIKKRFLPYCSA